MAKILIIEDNQDILENTAEILALEGYQVLTAANGINGVEIAFSEKPDLIFCDVMMPGLDGYSVLYLLGKNKETMSIPFIFLTARTDRSDIQKGLGLGATNYITKPFTDIELLDAIKLALQKESVIKPVRLCSENELQNFIKKAVGNFSLPISSNGIERKIYKKQEFLFSVKTKPTAAYYIVSGKIKSYLSNELGVEFITNIHGPGEFLGYTAILEGAEHKDNAIADEDTSVLPISKDDFLMLMHFNHSLTKEFISLLAGDNVSKEERLISLVYHSFRKRIIDDLLAEHEEIKSYKKEREFSDIFQISAGRESGSINEYLFTILKDLQAEHLIDIHEKGVVVMEEQRLKRLSNPTA